MKNFELDGSCIWTWDISWEISTGKISWANDIVTGNSAEPWTQLLLTEPFAILNNKHQWISTELDCIILFSISIRWYQAVSRQPYCRRSWESTSSSEGHFQFHLWCEDSKLRGLQVLWVLLADFRNILWNPKQGGKRWRLEWGCGWGGETNSSVLIFKKRKDKFQIKLLHWTTKAVWNAGRMRKE